MIKRITTLFFFCLTAVLIFAENPEKRTINADGFTREYLLYTPENQNDKTPEGIILCMHGFGRTTQDFFTQYDFREMADSMNYIIIAPQALKEQDPTVLFNLFLINLFSANNLSLNAVWGCGLEFKSYASLGYGIYIPTLSLELNKKVDDAGFIATIIDNTVSEYDMDGRNVFALGISMGSYMAYQLALKHGDKLSGMISFSGSMGLKIKATDSPVKVPICDFHSLTDNVVPYHGSYTQSGTLIALAFDKEKVIDYWVEKNMAGSPVVENVNYYPSTNDITVEKITYPAPDYEVIHYKINGSDHFRFFRKDVDCMDYEEEIAKFIQSHVSAPGVGRSILYVKQNSTGNGTGSSWANAYLQLADALLEAKTNANIKEIWVAAGTYKPQYAANDGTPSTDPRDRAFVLVNGVKIYGGFPADANDAAYTSIVARGSNPLLNATILSGDLSGNDTDDPTTRSDNAYHVVIGADIASDGETILDGFTITGGNADEIYDITANGQTVSNGVGGGITNYSSSPTLTNLIISGNTATFGGGIFNSASSPTLTNLTINGNEAGASGGGIYNESSSLTLTNATISGNTVSGHGGGIFNSSSSPTFTNLTISGNTAVDGGGIYNFSSSSPTFTNLTISGNTASNDGGGIFNEWYSLPKSYNTIVWGNSASIGNNVANNNDSNPTYNYSLVQDEDLTAAGTGNLNGTLPANNPLFVSPAVVPTPTITGDYRLLPASPLIDRGDNGSYATTRGLIPSLDIDLDGNLRLYGANIDLGAYEFSGLIWTGIAGNSWTEPANWNLEEIPVATSSVYIPGNRNTYPVLTETDAAVVKDIRFGPGAEIGRQDLLTYEKAYVQLDFSTGSLDRDRWYMLANPLRELYAVDFSFGGYPGMDMKLFKTEDDKAVWKRITGLEQSFSAGDGFIVWLASNPEGKGSKGLISSNSILELPYFDNPNVPAAVHWTHTYNDIAKESTIKGWKEENGSIVENEDTAETVVLRNNEAYRLAGREVNKTLDFGQDHFAIAGNPYMNSINFTALYDANKTLIKGTYQIWIGPGGTLGGSYAGYNVPGNAPFGRNDAPVDMSRYIAPMQSFIVEKLDASASANLAFDLAAIGTTGLRPGLRSTDPPVDKLDIVASTAQVGVRTVIVSRQEGGDSFGSADSRKLFDEINNLPEVYTLKPRTNNEQVATAVNVLDEITGETLIPLAISTTYSGELRFAFSGMDTYNARIFLLDTETNTEVELTNKAEYEYRFNYVPEQSTEKIVANESRFFIRLNKVSTGIETIAAEAVRIYAPRPGTLQVVSTHPLHQVLVYNLQGAKVYDAQVRSNTHKVEGLAVGVYLVKVVSGNTVTTGKVVVK